MEFCQLGHDLPLDEPSLELSPTDPGEMTFDWKYLRNPRLMSHPGIFN